MPEKKKNVLTMPLIPVRGTVIFPKLLSNLDIVRTSSVEAVREALNGDRRIFMVTQKDVSNMHPGEQDLFQMGTVVELRQFIQRTDDEYHILVSGLYRAKIENLVQQSPFYTANVVRVSEKRTFQGTNLELEAAVRAVKNAFQRYAMIIQKVPKELLLSVESETDALNLFYLLNNHILLKFEKKQNMLEENDILKRLHMLLEALDEESSIMAIERELFEKVEKKMDRNQRDYFLREQAKIINEELGYGEERPTDEYQAYVDKINAISHIDADSKEKLLGDAKRLLKMPESSHESYVIANYLDTVLSLPWDQFAEEKVDIKKAAEQLDNDHYGLTTVKDRILENIAVRTFKPDVQGQIICLVGPPGVGKTSIGRSIATALHRNFVRISLGGVSDESDIRGHRKTYIGAMPGRVISAIIQSKSHNPVVLLDEIDKLGSSFKGDPSSAMLEVLDPEQNCTFVDHYIEVPFDLSDCLFITTANTLSTISPPLLDRMEVIELSSYTLEEKFHICKEHLIPKEIQKHGLNKKLLSFTDDAIYTMIDGYTREAGVRTLERTVASICRKTAKFLAEEKKKSVRVTLKNLEQLLGPRKYLNENFLKTDQIGLVNGLAWTSVGGELMQIETSIMDGKGEVQLTGNLGSVMKESANTAISYVRSIANQFNIPTDFYQKKDIHIHVPEGAVPKDGPSAGIALATVLVSSLSQIPIRHDVAMTGEITLRGRVLAIGGLKEKAIAAFKSGIKTVLIPSENLRDLRDVDSAVKKSIEFKTCETILDVLNEALVSQSGNERKRQPAPNEKKSLSNDTQTDQGVLGI